MKESGRAAPIAVILLAAFAFTGCGTKDAPASNDSTATDPSSSATAANAPVSSGFDIRKVPVANPSLGKFPYLGLIEGYHPATNGENKNVTFDHYEFFDGSKIHTVEGRLATIEAEGQGSSAFQVNKTYESLVKELGGVTVFEGTADKMDAAGVKFSDTRHREPVYSGDEMGVYVVRTPQKDIWVETYVRQHGKEGTYFLTVVESTPLDVKASLLPAEEMKKELDAKGHVALYINFDFDKADIKPDSRPIVEQIVKLLKNNPTLELTVEGHTDNAGTPAYNRRLSEARAKSVVAALTAEGIEASRLKAAGYGQDKPIASNSTDEGRAKNRRVELVKVN